MTATTSLKDLKSAKAIANKTLKSLPNNKLLAEFAEIYMKAISKRTLLSSSPDELAKFLSERYKFFTQYIKTGKNHQFIKLEDTGNYALEYICKDAHFLLVTFETLFREYGLELNKKFHPVIRVKLDKSRKLSGFDRASGTESLISTGYFEFNAVEDAKVFDRIAPKVELTMDSAMMAYKDQEKMLTELSKLKDIVGKQKVILEEPREEWANLLDWLKNENFSFLGYIPFIVRPDGKIIDVKTETNKGLGLLQKDYLKREPSQLLENLKSHVWFRRKFSSPYVFDMLKVLSPIQRFENYMRLSFKVKNSDGTIVDHNFIGLLRRSSLQVKNVETPIIHLKMKYIFATHHMLPGSYDYNEVIRIFSSIPKYELFRTPADELIKIIEDIFSINNPNEIRVFTHISHNNSQRSLMVVMPPKLLTKPNVSMITNYLTKEIPHSDIEYFEVIGEEKSRVHYFFNQKSPEKYLPDCEALEKKIYALIKPWIERLKDTLLQDFSADEAWNLYRKYTGCFPEHHQLRRSPAETVRDIRYLEKMDKENQIQFNLVPFTFGQSVISGKASILFIYNKDKIDLINTMPIMQNLGLHVYDELTTRIGGTDNFFGYIHAFRVVDQYQKKVNEEKFREPLVDLLTQVFNGNTENDPLNALVILSELNWRTINVLQTYRNLYAQIGAPYSKDKINNAILGHPSIAKILVSFFIAKFSTEEKLGNQDYRSRNKLTSIKKEFIGAMQQVQSVVDDTILKRLFNLMENTLRTNFYIPKPNGETAISIRLDSRKIKQMPIPVPYKEIFVHDVGMEGTHLRFGPVARGGLRWSDRLDDFRKEVLGLVKTQHTKNVVIVPVGSKGGFVIKKRCTGRDELIEESKKQYKKFVSALLDLTDNVNQKGEAHIPKNVVAYDATDPYLVVAADKGTATFSDIANDISNQYNFWLEDAFASGGSQGYNHKEVGITAKGAWECVKLHFLEKEKDIQKDEATVVGVGDMSGDVFGNGMLLSKTLKVVAAFNHMHIFLDPDPVASESWKERQRLFTLPRSSWEDYDKKLISKGGGVYSRKAKEIRLTPEVKAMLNVKFDVMTGEHLVKAILKMDVDMLWFGGIGTYIKAPSQTHLEVGDPENDAVRIDANDCKAKILGEGANLGATQEGRIALSMNGIQLNTDFIDNSAGVNMSDYEVNIKILLKRMMELKKLGSMKQRNLLLKNATDEVTELVLKNNFYQHQLISMDALRSKRDFQKFTKTIQSLVSKKILDPKAENIPDPSVLQVLSEKGQPMPRPVLAVIIAYVKMSAYDVLINSSMLEDPFLQPFYQDYFPKSIKSKFKSSLHQHHLKNEILATQITNHFINHVGAAFLSDVAQQTGHSYDEIIKVYLILDASIGAQDFRDKIDGTPMPKLAKYQCLIEVEDLLATLCIEILLLPNITLSFSLVEQLTPLSKIIRSENKKSKLNYTKKELWKSLKIPESFAKELNAFSKFQNFADIFYVSHSEKISYMDAFIVVTNLDHLFGLEKLKTKLSTLEPKTIPEAQHRDAMLQTLRLQRRSMVQFIKVRSGKSGLSKLTSKSIVKIFKDHDKIRLEQFQHALSQVKHKNSGNLNALAVVINKLNSLIFT